MNHPILSSKRNLLIYSFIWLVCAITQGILVGTRSPIDTDMAFVDSIVFWGVFGFIGLSLWYLVYYNNLEKKLAITIIFHIASAVVAIGFLMFKSWAVSSFFFATHTLYTQFFKDTVFLRVFVGVMSYITVVFYYYSYIFYQNNKENKAKEEQYKTLLRDAELKSLKSQINPHFLFNSLNSISSLTIVEPEKAHEMIIKLSDYLRFSLSHKPDEFIPLSRELENIGRYLEIEKIRFGDRISFGMNVPQACHEVMVPTMILQPLFENAVKYGVHENTDTTAIKVTASLSASLMTITISNNFDPTSIPSRGQGIGISNIRERLSLLFGSEELMSIDKQHSQFTISIRFPHTPAS